MAKKQPTREDLLAMKRFISDRIISFVKTDPVLADNAKKDRFFADMLASAVRTFSPELKLWAMDVVWRE